MSVTVLIMTDLSVQATVAYYLFLDNKNRTTAGYLGAEYQEAMVSYEFFSFASLHYTLNCCWMSCTKLFSIAI
jgi:hypothetical protein